jgi:hypothetical protein
VGRCNGWAVTSSRIQGHAKASQCAIKRFHANWLSGYPERDLGLYLLRRWFRQTPSARAPSLLCAAHPTQRDERTGCE